jgi:predicted acetyltransferase
MGEFRAEGRGSAGDHSEIGQFIRDRQDAWSSDDAFRAFAEELHAQRLEESPRPAGFVPATELWWVDDAAILGRVGIRHRLTPALLEVGGHIGYDVRPSARRRGHATAMLRAALIVARELGIERALLTCNVDNVGSRTVIERNGGVLEDERAGKLRFWVPTHWSPHSDR